MKTIKWKLALLSTLTVALLTACGGGSPGDQKLRIEYSSLVSFGDSLSDVGTYQVGGIIAMGGGQYTVNSATAKNWTQLLAAQMGLPAPCPAQKGLDGNASYGLSVPVVNTAACLNYAQGGSRVTNPVGPGNKLLGGSNAILGQLTVPISTQINTHLTKVGGRFSGTEMVTVMAGANDVFINLTMVGMGAMSAPSAVTAMGTAGAELAAYIKTMVIDKGASKVLVLNVPDVKGTPFGMAKSPEVQGLIDLMVTTFNTQLKTGLQNTSGVLIVDAYTASKDETANPAQYGISNATTPACLMDLSNNALGTSLVCNSSNVVAGDVSKYLFADSVHPTPYGQQLIAQLVAKELVLAKWF